MILALWVQFGSPDSRSTSPNAPHSTLMTWQELTNEVSVHHRASGKRVWCGTTLTRGFAAPSCCCGEGDFSLTLAHNSVLAITPAGAERTRGPPGQCGGHQRPLQEGVTCLFPCSPGACGGGVGPSSEWGPTYLRTALLLPPIPLRRDTQPTTRSWRLGWVDWIPTAPPRASAGASHVGPGRRHARPRVLPNRPMHG